MAVAAPAASADELVGDWLFQTSVFEGDCMIKGTMTIRKTQLRNTYSGTFLSEQICGPKYFNMYIKVSQTATIQKVGKQVAIKSQVKQIIEGRADIQDFRSDYLADNFVLAMSKNMNEMLGDHYDAQRQLKARFWRDEQLIS